MTATFRDLAVSHFKRYQFAQKKGDEAMMQSALHGVVRVVTTGIFWHLFREGRKL